MKIIINGVTYTQIKNLSFAPETDITGNEAVINKFSADIMTASDIDVGANAYLYDDLDNLWAKYWLVESVRKEKNTLSIEAQSILRILDRKTMDAAIYNGMAVTTILSNIFSGLTSEYTLDSSFSSKTISGYCPKQTARERLQWICFCIGAYLKTFFTDKILILPVDTSAVTVPMEKTFWKPSVTYGDYVTAVKATAYSYSAGLPQNTDKWVQVGNNYYIETSQEFTVSNPSAPVTANENVVSVSDVKIINTDNVSEILTLLSTYYFKRIEVDADIINNGEYAAGDKVIVPVDDSNFIAGFIKSESFTFGLQAKSKIKLMQTDMVSGTKLIILRRFDGVIKATSEYLLPRGYNYSIQNPYMDIIEVGMVVTGFSRIIEEQRMWRYMQPFIRVVYYPFNQYATGTVTGEVTNDYEDYGEALIFYVDTNEAYDPRIRLGNMSLLYMLSVDGVSSVVEDGEIIVEVD